jgi:hypothetical protein
MRSLDYPVDIKGLHSGKGGKVVTSPKQAIALSEAKVAKAKPKNK